MSMEHIAENPKAEIKKSRVEDAIAARRRKKILQWGGGGLIITLFVGMIIWSATRPQAPLPGVSYANQGQDHVPLDHKDTYNSNPPTSGPHYQSPGNWGMYDYESNDKIFIHNLEHGGIWISYKPSVSKEVVAELNDFVKSFGGSKLVASPRSANDTDVAIAAWTRLYTFNISGGHLSAQQKKDLETFYVRLKNRGPENVPDAMTGVDPKTIQESK